MTFSWPLSLFTTPNSDISQILHFPGLLAEYFGLLTKKHGFGHLWYLIAFYQKGRSDCNRN